MTDPSVAAMVLVASSPCGSFYSALRGRLEKGDDAMPDESGDDSALTPVKRVVPDLPDLTSREATVLQRIAAGDSDREIAKSLYVSEATIACTSKSLTNKFGARNRPHLIALAAKLAMLDLPTLVQFIP